MDTDRTTLLRPLFAAADDADDLSCPLPEDRFFVMEDWDCDDYNCYMKLSTAFIINVFLVKTLQTVGFAYLGVRLVSQ